MNTQYWEVHPQNPQPRVLQQVARVMGAGGVVALPTDSSYALACHLDDKDAAGRLRQLRGVGDKHHLTILCRDLSEIANYALVDNRQFRLMKIGTPGPYTFILDATREVPRRLSHPSRKTIGLRVPEHAVTQALLALLGGPILATTLILPGDLQPLNDAQEIAQALRGRVDGVLDAGGCAQEPTTVLDLTGMAKSSTAAPVVVRQGLGSLAALGLSE